MHMHDQLTNDGLVMLVDERLAGLRDEAASERLAHVLPPRRIPQPRLRAVVGRALIGLGAAIEGPPDCGDDPRSMAPAA
jgi:hypothetical protein